jgi:hypothetical protein
MAKVLVGRLSIAMSSLILSTQFAFLKGHNLVVVNEVLDLAKKIGRRCLVLNVDFEKLFDSVNWGILEYMLRRFGFNNKWIGWTKACVYGGNMSISVNESLTEKISIQRCLKQRGPFGFVFVPIGCRKFWGFDEYNFLKIIDGV